MNRKVALIIETSSAYGRDVLGGVVRFMRMHEQWSVYLDERDLWQAPPEWLSDWQGDGIISRISTPSLRQAVAQTKVPMVEVADRHDESTFPQIRSDDVAIGEAGARHLIERGFRRFAFCGYEAEAWSERRESGFLQTILGTTGLKCEPFNSIWHGEGAPSWETEQQALAAWLTSLQPPFAVMACNDVRGRQVVDACARLGLKVPEEVAIVGVDNDELLCRACAPPLSSIRPNAESVGFCAADLLSRMMDGDSVLQRVQLVQPLGVAIRQSSDVVAIEDRRAAAALHYIRANACRGLHVGEVVDATGIPRATLERLIRKHLGRSPQAEIRRTQIKRVEELLLTTDLSHDRIAVLSGFDHAEYMHVVFKRVNGMTPGQFRSGTSAPTTPGDE